MFCHLADGWSGVQFLKWEVASERVMHGRLNPKTQAGVVLGRSLAPPRTKPTSLHPYLSHSLSLSLCLKKPTAVTNSRNCC